MKTDQVIFIYCVCDDLLRHLGVQDDLQSKMSSAEIICVAVTAAWWFQGRISSARLFLMSHGYIKNMLSHGRLNRRMLAIDQDIWQLLLTLVSRCLKASSEDEEYVVDSFPVPACHPCRSWRCKLFTGKKFLGYCASKKMRYFGLKAHILVSSEGHPIEFILTPASRADVKGLELAHLNLSPGSFIYADRGYTSYGLEDELRDIEEIYLIAQRKGNSRRQHSLSRSFLQEKKRKVVETVISQITRRMPRGIAARSAEGFSLRVFLFVLSYSFEKLEQTGRSVG